MELLGFVTRQPASSVNRFTTLRKFDCETCILTNSVQLPDESQQVALFSDTFIYKTPTRKLIEARIVRTSGSEEISSNQPDVLLAEECEYLMQTRTNQLCVLKQLQGYTIKRICHFQDSSHVLEYYGIQMRKFFAMDAREGDSLLICIAGLDLTVEDEIFKGPGVLVFNVDKNNSSFNIKFHTMAVHYRTLVCIRCEDILVWMDGDVKDVRRIELASLAITRWVTTCDMEFKRCMFKYLKDQVFLIAQASTLTKDRTYRQDIRILRFHEKFNSWTQICEIQDAFLESVGLVS